MEMETSYRTISKFNPGDLVTTSTVIMSCMPDVDITKPGIVVKELLPAKSGFYVVDFPVVTDGGAPFRLAFFQDNLRPYKPISKPLWEQAGFLEKPTITVKTHVSNDTTDPGNFFGFTSKPIILRYKIPRFGTVVGGYRTLDAALRELTRVYKHRRNIHTVIGSL